MKQHYVVIQYRTFEEMAAIRSVMRGFGYPIYSSFNCSNNMGGYDCVMIDGTDASRGRWATVNTRRYTKLTLQEFIANEGKEVVSPEQARVASVKAQIAIVQQQIDGKQKELAQLIASL